VDVGRELLFLGMDRASSAGTEKLISGPATVGHSPKSKDTYAFLCLTLLLSSSPQTLNLIYTFLNPPPLLFNLSITFATVHRKETPFLAPQPPSQSQPTPKMADTAAPLPSTPSSDDLPMFSASLIPPSVSSSLPSSYTVRPAHASDYHRGFLTVLATLTSTPMIPFEDFAAQVAAMMACKDTYYILVICDRDGWVVGTGSLIVERKFIHGLGLVGHVEDISVRRDQQGKKLGLKLIQALEGVGRAVGCYKVCLFSSVLVYVGLMGGVRRWGRWEISDVG
jgi:glucosamine-phosphate N-acetyltransferase